MKVAENLQNITMRTETLCLVRKFRPRLKASQTILAPFSCLKLTVNNLNKLALKRKHTYHFGQVVKEFFGKC